MSKARIAISIALGGALFTQCAVADEVVLQASKDNTIFEDTTLSNGAGEYFFAGVVGSNGGFKKRRALLAFDLSAVPAGATIESVSLDLHLAQNVSTAQISLHRLLGDWGEAGSNTFGGGGGAPAQIGDATWQYKFFDGTAGTPWTAAGGDFVQSESASETLSATGEIYTIDSTPQLVADVQGWLEQGNNFGWLIKGDESRTFTPQKLSSRQNLIAEFRPSLKITFATAQPQWNLDGNGSWGVASNWSNNAVPNHPTAIANFLGKTTAPRTITLDGNVTVQRLNFGHF